MKLFLAVIFLATVANAFPKSSCGQICPKNYLPVCGYDGRSFKIFNNKCLLENQHCLDNMEWDQVEFSLCTVRKSNVCDTNCDKVLAPVCGVSGEKFQLFPNLCIMQKQHCTDNLEWTKTEFSNCIPKIDPRTNICDTNCDKMLAPVCGVSGEKFQLFPNLCIMQKQHCTDNLEWTKTEFSNCIPKIDPRTNICDTNCDKMLAPVCGVSGEKFQLFPNLCIMQKQHCTDNLEWTKTEFSNCIPKIDP